MASGSPGQIKAGGAYVEVGIRDETRSALNQIRQVITQSLRDTAQQANAQLAPIRSSLGGGGGAGGNAGKFGQIGQNLAFGLEDAASQFGTSGWAGALRGASNNLSMVGMQMFGIKGLMASIALTTTLQLIPAFNKWLSSTKGIKEQLDSLNRTIAAGAAGRSHRLDREGINGRVAKLETPEQVGEALQENFTAKRRLEFVDLKSAEQEIAALMDSKAHEQARLADHKRNPGRALEDMLAGIEPPAKALAEIEERLGAANARERDIKERIVTLDQERARLEKQIGFVQNQQRANLKRDLRASMVGAADALVGDDWGERRQIEKDRLENLKKLQQAGVIGADNPSAGVDAMHAANRLADLQLRSLRLRDANPFLMPATLQQGSVAAARQAEQNRRQQYDPAVVELKAIKQEAEDLRTLLEELLGNVEEGN